jgi:hypothetical protein
MIPPGKLSEIEKYAIRSGATVQNTECSFVCLFGVAEIVYDKTSGKITLSVNETLNSEFPVTTIVEYTTAFSNIEQIVLMLRKVR